MPDAKTPALTVVVCSFNGAETLGACLSSLERQSIRRDLQIVVVDDGSRDGTAEVAKAFDVELIEFEANQGLSKARNAGIENALGPIVAFTDDDCIAASDWCERLLAGYERDDVVGVGGAVAVHEPSSTIDRYLVDNNPLSPLELELDEQRSLPGRLALYLRGMWRSPRSSPARAVFSFPGANMSFRRDALDAVGGFDDRMTFGADDEYICSKMRSSYPDKLLWFDPTAVIEHDFVGTMQDVIRRNYAYGRGHARSYALEPDRGWPIIFPAPILFALGVLLLRRPYKLALPAIAIILVLPQGLVSVAHHRRLENIVFSYLRLIEESALNAGMFVGLIVNRSSGVRR